MKTIGKISLLLAFTSVLFFGCQKETSFEQGNTHASVGAMQVDGSGNCLGAVVSGLYYKDTTLKSSNYVDVNVQVDTAGSYTISTDQVNGYSFSAKGTFTDTGSKVVRLVGTGKPLSPGTNVFTVTYNGTTCEFTVTVGLGTGGSSVFTVNCSSAIANGTYLAGTALTTSNTVSLTVNVTTVGSWSITTAPAVNGMIFSGSGTFSSTGSQTITLNGSGTPTIAGTFNFPVTVNGSTCNFSVTCTAVVQSDYFPRTAYSNWSYEFDDNVNDSLLIKVIPQTITITGNVYNIFMLTVNAAGTPPFDTSGYYRRSGSDYFERNDMSLYAPIDNALHMEFIFLKDNLSAGGTWSSSQFTGPVTQNGTTIPAVTFRWDFTIVQKDVSVTVNGQTYANTIEVKQELKYLAGSTWTLFYYFDNFYARNKGLIKQDIYVYDSSTGNSTLFSQMDIRRLAVY